MLIEKRFIDESAQQPFIYLIDKILAITKVTPLSWLSDKEHKQDACDTIKEYERQIDNLVYKLYGLTDVRLQLLRDSALSFP